MEKQLSEKLPRIEVVDALRGFAVMAILLVHNLEHFIFPVYPTGDPGWLNILNDGVFNITFSLFAGKAYAIFALLFGFTFYIQSANQQRKGKDFGYRFLWRLVLLAVFATVNAAFFPAGDVLLLFVVVGVVLFVVRKWSDCAILVTAIVFLLQPLYSKFVRPVAYVARFGGRSNVSGSGGLYERGEFGRVLMEEHHLRSKSEFVLGIGCRTFLADCRFVPDGTVYRP